MRPVRIYVIGSEGQVARALREAATDDDCIVLTCSSRNDFNLLRRSGIDQALTDFRPDVVINPAAYTNVDKAESEPELAYAVNRDGAQIVAAAAALQGVPVIHFSTDYVFDGKKTAAYLESDPVNPQSVYGSSKAEGEAAVAAANPRYVVLRTSWVYAPYGTNFVRTILRLADDRDRLRVVNDQLGCPTYAADIATAAIAVAKQVAGAGWRNEHAGVTHLAGPNALSWCGFARKIMQQSGRRGRRSVPIDPIATSEYATAAVRPANSRLSSARLAKLFGLHIPPLDHSLSVCMDRLFRQAQVTQ
jgi:dTDP-4-dehydrorhamnose reductase